MGNVKYEEYQGLTKGLPFVLHPSIRRSLHANDGNQNWHENIELQLCTEGRGGVLLDGKSYHFQKHDIVIVNPNVLHYTWSDCSMEYACLIPSTDFCSQMGIDPHALSFAPIVRNERLTELFLEILSLYPSHDALRTARLNRGLLELLIEAVEKHAISRARNLPQDGRLDAVKRAILFLREHYTVRITLDQIAEYARLDKYALCRDFKRFTGQTVFENLNHYRCIKAAELLDAGSSVSEAAYRCGFESASFFTKVFHRYMGILPSAYKRQSL